MQLPVAPAPTPPPMGLGQAFTWFSWFCFFPIVSDWMGMAVYRGKASCDCASGPQACIESKCQFNRGIAMAGIGLMAKAGTWVGHGRAVRLADKLKCVVVVAAGGGNGGGGGSGGASCDGA